MKINELNTLLRSRLMTRGIPCKAHQMKDGSFHVSIILTGRALSVEIPYTIREMSSGELLVCSDNKEFIVKKLTSAVAVISKDVRLQRTALTKYTKR